SSASSSLRPSPRCVTLFPYTTLFRSARIGSGSLLRQRVEVLHVGERRAVDALHFRVARLDHVILVRRVRSRSMAEPEVSGRQTRSEEHTSELQSRGHLVCRLLLEKKK